MALGEERGITSSGCSCLHCSHIVQLQLSLPLPFLPLCSLSLFLCSVGVCRRLPSICVFVSLVFRRNPSSSASWHLREVLW